MNKKLFDFGIVFIFLIIISSSIVVGDDVLKSASELDYPPLSIVTENGEADGFAVELLRAALNSVGKNVSFYVGPWSEIKEDLAEGRIDVLPVVGRTPEREPIYDFSVPYKTLYGSVFVRDSETSINSFDDLKDKEIILMKGDNAEEYVRRENLSDKIILTDSFDDAFELLSQGKHDAVITQTYTGLELLDKNQITNILPAFELKKYKQDFTFGVKEGDISTLLILNEGLSRIITDGTYDKIEQKWYSDKYNDIIDNLKSKSSENEIDFEERGNSIANDFVSLLDEAVSDTLYISNIVSLESDLNSDVLKSKLETFSNSKQKEIWYNLGKDTAPLEQRLDVPLYKEITIIDEFGNEIIKYEEDDFSDELKDVSKPENTEFKSETYFQETKSLDPGKVNIGKVMTWYTFKNDIFSELPPDEFDNYEKVIGRDILKQGVIRFSSPIYKDGNFKGVVVLSLDYRHLQELTKHVDPAKNGPILSSQYSGNYLLVFDVDGNTITHPKPDNIRGYLEDGRLAGFNDGVDDIAGNIFNLYKYNKSKAYNNMAVQVLEDKDVYTSSATDVSGRTKLTITVPILYSNPNTNYADVDVFGGIMMSIQLLSDSEDEVQIFNPENIKYETKNIAKQIEAYMKSHPDYTLQDLREDELFNEIAIKSIGERGYSLIYDYDTLISLFHFDEKQIGLDYNNFETQLPSFWNIIGATRFGKQDSYGYYEWREPNGELNQKYMYIKVISKRTKDDVGLALAVTTYIDEYDDIILEEKEFSNNIDFFRLILFIIATLVLSFFFISTKNSKITSTIKYYRRLIIVSFLLLLTDFLTSGLIKNDLFLLIVTRFLFAFIFLSQFLLFFLIISFKHKIDEKYFKWTCLFLSVLLAIFVLTNLVLADVVFEDFLITSNGILFVPMMILTSIVAITSLVFSIINYRAKSKEILLVSFTNIFFILFNMFIGMSQLHLQQVHDITTILLIILISIILFRNKTIQYKHNYVMYILSITFLIIISLFLINTWQVTQNVRNTETESVKDYLNGVVISRSQHIETYIDDHIKFFELVNSRNKLRNQLSQYNEEPKQEYVDNMRDIIVAAKEPIEDYERIFILDLDGNIIVSTNDSFIGRNVADKEFFKIGKENTKAFVVVENSVPKLFVSGPYIYNGEIIGVGIAVSKINRLNYMMTENAGFLPTEEVYIVNKEGYMITPSRFVNNSIFNVKIDNHNLNNCWLHETLSDIELKRNHQETIIYDNYINSKVLGTHAYIEKMDWCVISEVNQKDFLKKVESNIRRIWYFTLGVIVSMIVVAFVFNYLLTNTLRKQIEMQTNKLQTKVHKDEKTRRAMLHLLKDMKLMNKEITERETEAKLANKQLKILNREKDNFSKTLEKTVKSRTGQLQRANKNITKLLKTKTEFLNQVAHDLRTPLTPITILLQNIMKTAKLDKQTKERLTVVKNNVDSLSYLITDVLNVVRIESGKSALDIKKTNIVSLIKTFIDSHKPALDKEKIEIKAKFDKNLPDVYIDTNKIDELIGNIVSNSKKYNDKKTGKFILFEVVKKGAFVQVKITDNGRGVEKKNIEKIFEEFFKTDQYQGGSSTGLGLNICKKMIEQHHGKIWAESPGLGKGLSIYFTLPIKNMFTTNRGKDKPKEEIKVDNNKLEEENKEQIDEIRDEKNNTDEIKHETTEKNKKTKTTKNDNTKESTKRMFPQMC
jgi:signal transduction histidine kinase/ABC-type amino acid transport substrate-binding protein